MFICAIRARDQLFLRDAHRSEIGHVENDIVFVVKESYSILVNEHNKSARVKERAQVVGHLAIAARVLIG